MKQKPKNINSPDELNKNLSYNSPVTWVTLGAVILVLAGFFIWSFVGKIEMSLFGMASISNSVVTLNVEQSKLDRLQEGQKVYISGAEGSILSFDNEHQPVVSNFNLADGNYEYRIVLKQMKPIDFWFNQQ